MTKTDDIDLRADLIEAIAESGLSVRQLSIRSGAHYQTVHGFVHHDRDIGIGSISKLCRVLGLRLRPVKRGKTKEAIGAAREKGESR